MGSTGFDLQQSIANHVQLIKGQGSTTRSDEAELTTHLYDACEDLMRHGLNEEEAFMIARSRLGDMEVLTEEYGKVNPSVSTNKVWAYLLLGVSLIAGVWKLITFGVGYIYLLTNRYFSTSYEAVLAVVIFNALLMALIWYLVKKKHDISRYLEEQVANSPVKIVLWSFIPFLSTLILPYDLREKLTKAFTYPMYQFQSRVAELSFSLLIFSVWAGLLCLIFSLRKTEHITLKSLFEKPSVLFLVVFGGMIEVLASFTRLADLESMWWRGFVFGLVYLAGTFLVCYYNQKENLLRYVLIFSGIGFALEVSVGIMADLDRGNTVFTAYFAAGLILGVLSGALLGLKMKQTTLAVN